MRITRCDGIGCLKERPQQYNDGYYDWLIVEASEDCDHGQFCSWTCLAGWATNRAVDREGGFERLVGLDDAGGAVSG